MFKNFKAFEEYFHELDITQTNGQTDKPHNRYSTVGKYQK